MDGCCVARVRTWPALLSTWPSVMEMDDAGADDVATDNTVSNTQCYVEGFKQVLELLAGPQVRQDQRKCIASFFDVLQLRGSGSIYDVVSQLQAETALAGSSYCCLSVNNLRWVVSYFGCQLVFATPLMFFCCVGLYFSAMTSSTTS